jgi:hypothetical protein
MEKIMNQFEKRTEEMIQAYWTPNSAASQKLGAELKAHIQRVLEKLNTAEVELKIDQVTDELGQLQSDAMIAETSDDEKALKEIQKMIDQRQAELVALKEDLGRRKGDVLNPRTLAYLTDPLFTEVKKDIQRHEKTMAELNNLYAELLTLQKLCGELVNRIKVETFIPDSNIQKAGSTVVVDFIGDMAQYTSPLEIHENNGGLMLHEHIKTYQPVGKVSKYAFFGRK